MLGAQRQMVIVVARGMSQHAARPSSMVDKFVRVDHAGELGADRIYAGQLAILGELHKFHCEMTMIKFLNKFSRSYKSWSHNQAHVGAGKGSPK